MIVKNTPRTLIRYSRILPNKNATRNQSKHKRDKRSTMDISDSAKTEMSGHTAFSAHLEMAEKRFKS
ncbi:hypothetical protein ALO_07258 [Acetonema longum DSM 6540]|uniref:Uncharacterized protein n=2 Tax=Acetonema TaxID=2373 RepID=F7NHA6_9FIRM|nr:hypothetical protein ALO_07258 [Acetonema longum DSM 6540]